MVSRDLSAGQLRYHLQDLSVSVARRLVAVLDAARDAPHGVAAELDAVVAEITNIQRDLAYEMAGPPTGGAADLASLSRMLDLQHRMLHLLDRLETLSVRPITNYLDQHQRTAPASRGEWTAPAAPRPHIPHYSEPHYDVPQPLREPVAVQTWSQPHHEVPVPAHAYTTARQHVQYEPQAAGAAPFLAQSLGAGGAVHAPGATRWPHFSPAARWGLLPMAICIVSALLTTTANHLLQGDAAGIFNAEHAAKRGDRLDTGSASDTGGRIYVEPPDAKPSSRLDQVVQGDAVSKPSKTAAIVVSPPSFSDRGLDALNPDAPSVAILATAQDPEAARRLFAELKQRYPEILGASEAELDAVQTQDGKTWHRVSLLPPVPRSEAKDLCKRLRTAGFQGCWVKSRADE